MGQPSFEVLVRRADQELSHLHNILHDQTRETPLANQQRMHEAIERARAELQRLRKYWRDEGRYD